MCWLGGGCLGRFGCDDPITLLRRLRALAYHRRVRKELTAIVFSLGLASLGTLPAVAQTASAGSPGGGVRPAQTPHNITEYGGVVPGRSNPPPATNRLTSRRRGARPSPTSIVTWPGFQMTSSGGSRFFVQTTAAVTTRVSESDGRVEVLFPNTAIHLSNSGRWLETQYFETPVMRARFERRGRDMVLVMTMRARVTPQISTATEGNFSFVYVDFAAGRYRPAEMAPVQPPAQRSADGSTSIRPATPESERRVPERQTGERMPTDSEQRDMDRERPPDVR